MKIGRRQIKTVIAVFCCLILNVLISWTNSQVLKDLYTPFFAALATVYCISQDKDQSFQMAKIRGGGSILGGIIGFLVISLTDLLKSNISNEFIGNLVSCIMIAVCIILVIQTTVLCKMQKLTFIACLTYLSVTVGNRVNLSSFMFASNRVLSSLIGILIALIINNIHERNRDFSEVEKHFYLNVDNFNELSGYVRQKLNYYLKNNLKIHFLTNYSPYEVLDKYRGLKIDTIYALGGDIIYDVGKYHFLDVTVFSGEKREKIEAFMRHNKYFCFKYVLQDDVLICTYDFDLTEADLRFMKICKKHKFHNFMRGDLKLEAINYAFTFKKEDRKKVCSFFESCDCFSFIEEDDVYCYIRIFDNKLNQNVNNVLINFHLDYRESHVIIKNQVDIIKVIKQNIK